MFKFAKKHLNLTLKEFVELWITPHNSGKFKVRSIEIPFFCCNCYDKKSRNIIDNNLLIITSWLEGFYNAILEAVQEKVEEKDITAFIEKENTLMILNYLSDGPITIENLKEWYTNKYPDDNFYKLIRNLITLQMISIPNVGKSKNPPFNVYIAEDIKTITRLISLKNKLLKLFIKNHQKESPEVIKKRTRKLQEIIESSLL